MRRTSTAAGERYALNGGVPSVAREPAPREETQKLHALAEAAAQDLAIARHLGADGEDLARTEVEATIERIERSEDLRAAQVRIAQHAALHATGVDQCLGLQPAAGLGLAVQR